MKRLFTLIELIMVITVLGILATIVIPNISNIKQEASKTALISDIASLQTATDMYLLSGKFPSVSSPVVDIPQPLDFGENYYDYLRNLPKNKDMYYWIDYKGQVWGSTSDSPVIISSNGNFIEWFSDEAAKFYRVYKVEDGGNNSASAYDSYLFLIKEIPADGSASYYYGDLDNGKYLVSSVDKYGLESAPSGIGYLGYPYEDWDSSLNKGIPPVAVISKNKTILSQGEGIDWSSDSSYHPDGLEITEVEWGGAYRDTYDEVGEHTIFLRVKSENGVWSPVVSDTIFVDNSDDISFGDVEGYVEIPDKEHYGMKKEEMTMEMWIKPNTWDSRESKISSIISKRETNQSGFFMYYNGDLDTLIIDFGGVKERWILDYAPELDVWTHVAYTYDGEKGRFYVNGELHNETDEYGDPHNLDNAPIKVGKDFAFGNDDYYFNGSVKGLRIWDEALPEESINRNKDYFSNYNDDRLLGAWSIYENIDNKVFDMSPYRNHGVFNYD